MNIFIDWLPLVDLFTNRKVDFDYTLDDMKIAYLTLGLDKQNSTSFFAQNFVQ